MSTTMTFKEIFLYNNDNDYYFNFNNWSSNYKLFYSHNKMKLPVN